jgi:hypothetical protein
MKTKKTHRRYPENDWDYKAISTIINDDGTKREVIYYSLISKGVKKEGIEVYAGSNYIAGSTDKSSSRNYAFMACPAKYKEVVSELKKVHRTTKWSTAKKVNEN